MNGEKVTPAFGVNINQVGSRSNVLTIDSISGQHAGNYTCVVKNLAGTAIHSTMLIVNGLFYQYISEIEDLGFSL